MHVTSVFLLISLAEILSVTYLKTMFLNICGSFHGRQNISKFLLKFWISVSVCLLILSWLVVFIVKLMFSWVGILKYFDCLEKSHRCWGKMFLKKSPKACIISSVVKYEIETNSWLYLQFASLMLVWLEI